MNEWFKLPFEPRTIYIILPQSEEKGNKFLIEKNRGTSAAHTSVKILFIFKFREFENTTIFNFQLSIVNSPKRSIADG